MTASKCGNALALLALSAPWAYGARLARDRSGTVKDGYSRYDGKALLHLAPCTEKEAADMAKFLEEQECVLLSDTLMAHPSEGCGDAAATCAADAAAAVEKKFGNLVRIASSDAGAFYRETSGTAVPFVEAMGVGELSSDFYSDWRDLDARYGRVEAAVASSGGAATMGVAGQSFEGRPIKFVRFTGAGYTPGKPKVLLTFNLHAREWIAGMAGVYAVEKLAEMVKKDPDVIAGMEVVMVPMANPDGFVETLGSNRFHRKNMNSDVSWFGCEGVDLNRNFDSKWNSGGSSGWVCSDTYHGPGPNSEPETKTVVSLMDEAPMTVYIDVHSYTQLILSSWGWTREDHPRKAEFKELGQLMQAAIAGSHGQTFREGPTAQLLYAASGTSTDLATEKGALGYCYELRPGSNSGMQGFAPPASEILPGVEECFAGIVSAIEYARTK